MMKRFWRYIRDRFKSIVVGHLIDYNSILDDPIDILWIIYNKEGNLVKAFYRLEDASAWIRWRRGYELATSCIIDAYFGPGSQNVFLFKPRRTLYIIDEHEDSELAWMRNYGISRPMVSSQVACIRSYRRAVSYIIGNVGIRNWKAYKLSSKNPLALEWTSQDITKETMSYIAENSKSFDDDEWEEEEP